ncbi:hypothetical protein BH23PLA1_BH23PLA1_06780 [soil metagenome]
MMSIPLSDRQRRPFWPVGLLGMLALISGVEWQVNRHRRELTPFEVRSWTESGRAARTLTQNLDILCVGDSLMKLGVVPKVIDRRLGVRSYNLAACAADVPATYIILRRSLEAGARPSAIIMTCEPNLLSQGPGHFSRYWPSFATSAELAELLRTARDPELIAELAIARLFPSVEARFDLQTFAREALAGYRRSHWEVTPAYLRNWARNQGAQLMPPDQRYQADEEPDLYGDKNPLVYPRYWRCHRVNEHYLHEIFLICKQADIAMYWLIPPYSPNVLVGRERCGADEAFTRFIHTFGERYPNLTVLDARRSGFDHSVFIDGIHLDRRGAFALSQVLCDVLADQSTKIAQKSRWVELSVFPSLEDDADFEDTAQSAMALHDAGWRAR